MSHRRQFKGTVQTGPASHVLPWQVEWIVGQSFNCYVGRVHDEDSIGKDAEFSQKRFSANQQQRILISQHKMSSSVLNRNITSMEKSAHSVGVKTGSSLIYVQDGRGRITAPSDSVSETLGYAGWPESTVRGSSKDTYFVLHKVRIDGNSYDQWCLSVVDSDDVTDTDIKIACFKYARGGSASRANLIQLWKSDIIQSGENYSFKISTTINDSSVDIKIWDGAVSNVTCSNSDSSITKSEDGFYAIVIQVTCEDGTYPADVVWDAILDWDEYTQNTLGSAWVLIGYVEISTTGGKKKTSITQYVRSSLRTERLQYGTDDTSVRYYFNSI